MPSKRPFPAALAAPLPGSAGTEPATPRTTPRAGRPGRTREREDIGVTRTLDRGLAILEAVAAEGEATLSEVARATAMSASTAFRLIETLERRGFLAREEETGNYRIGSRAFDVGSAFSGAARLNDVARPLMRRLAEELGEGVALGIREGSQVMYVEQIEAKSAVRMSARLGSRMPVHCTAVGKVLVAWLWETRIDEIVGPEPYPSATAATLTTRSALLAELAQVRERGHAVDAQEFEADVRCVAAPVRNREGEVVAALSVSAPAGRLSPARVLAVVRPLVAAADELSSRLGWRARPRGARSSPANAESLFED
jgi:IclR family acetate operon transcriptional repressor